MLNAYADASGDYNPIHIDEAFAKTTPMGGTIAHGMLVLSFISEMMTGAFRTAWLSTGTLEVRFRARPAPATPLRRARRPGAEERPPALRRRMRQPDGRSADQRHGRSCPLLKQLVRSQTSPSPQWERGGR